MLYAFTRTIRERHLRGRHCQRTHFVHLGTRGREKELSMHHFPVPLLAYLSIRIRTELYVTWWVIWWTPGTEAYVLRNERFPADQVNSTGGQWSYMPASTWAVRKIFAMVSICILSLTTILVAMETSKQPQWPRRSDITSDLKSASLMRSIHFSYLLWFQSHVQSSTS